MRFSQTSGSSWKLSAQYGAMAMPMSSVLIKTKSTGTGLDHHHIEDVDDHAHQHRQGRGAGHDEHGQPGYRGQKGTLEEAAAHPDEG